MTPRLDKAFSAIDAANARDPGLENGKPANLLYGQRMTEEQQRLFPEASEPLRIACRGQLFQGCLGDPLGFRLNLLPALQRHAHDPLHCLTI